VRLHACSNAETAAAQPRLKKVTSAFESQVRHQPCCLEHLPACLPCLLSSHVRWLAHLPACLVRILSVIAL